MAIADALLPEFDHEISTTRRVLDRVPDDQLAWKPHAKSMSLADLATHVSELLTWTEPTMTQPAIDVAGFAPPAAVTSRAELLRRFDQHAAGARRALAGRSDAEFLAMWSLKQNGKELFSMPKAAVIRSFVMNHLIHHRAQLAVYLRLLDVPVPSIYGPSADERGMP